MIRLDHVDKYFNRFKKNQIHVINDTSLAFDSTGLVALLGPSGSGKTTLLNVIGGLDKVRKGSIYVNGNKITGKTQYFVDKIRNLNIGYIFQDYKLIENMSVYDNVSLVLKMIGIKDKKEIDKRVCYVLDRVGMLRYKKRPCNMLSGGERQRVGIARAIVKNPNIIIADEPTGNLDSKNTLEIMNIIKAISRDKLVILVTHENTLAHFYASRIIELEDGKITRDYENKNDKDLDYKIDNTLYLKDYEYHEKYDNIHVYSDEKDSISLNIVISNHNIYIESLDSHKIEVLDENSSVEMIDDHQKSMTKEEMEKYQFDYNQIITNPKKLKYSSIFNPITFITNGFRKVLDYSLLKKILLIGFFLSGIFILYAASSIMTTLTVRDEDFIKINSNYLVIDAKKIKVEDYEMYEKELGVQYMLPTDSNVKLVIKNEDFYQTTNASIDGNASIASLDLINEDQILIGRMPENSNEVVLDQMVLERIIKQGSSKMLGLGDIPSFLGKDIKISGMDNLKIVGIVHLNSPSFYIKPELIINFLYHNPKDDEDSYYMFNDYDEEGSWKEMDDYSLFLEKMELKEGRLPDNDYETIIPISYKEQYKIGKEVNFSVGDKKLVVVGYYTSKDQLPTYLVHSNMIKRQVILTSSNMVVYPTDKDTTMTIAREKFHLNIKDSYVSSRDKYMKEQSESVKSSLISSGIILGISFIEIFLMIRSSFLSRIKEVGIYRAIGVKKKDIYIMFMGESIAITTMACVPGVLLSSYILKLVSQISFIDKPPVINLFVILFSIVLLYAFNLIMGLIPVFHTIRKRPAEILSRTDI